MEVRVDAKELYVMNQQHDGQVADMVELSHLHQAALLNNVTARFLKGNIYTRAGEILIAMNPYSIPLDDAGVSVYDEVYVSRYQHRYGTHTVVGLDAPDICRCRPNDAALEHMPAAKRAVARLPPHVFEVADKCFRALLDDDESQSCVISGESGAGKTETTKLILQYLTHASTTVGHSDESTPAARRGSLAAAALDADSARARSFSRRGSLGSSSNPFHASVRSTGVVEKALLESNPVLEAFGNAKTVRNDNSSRFGKLLKLYFGKSGGIAAAQVSHFLLEKSRVVAAGPKERSYHIFYQLLAGTTPSERAALRLGEAQSYRLLADGGADIRVPGVDDATEFAHVRAGLTAVGVEASQQDQVWRIVAAVLLLGNVRFSGEDDCRVAKASTRDANTVADLLGVSRDALTASLTSSSIQAGGKALSTSLRRQDAEAGALSFAKHLYAGLFAWLVGRVNSRIESHQDTSAPFIGILDIFGFEVFDRNGFEQLCINYANERLQQFFTAHVFALEAATYEAEAIDYAGVEFKDNRGVVALVDHKPRGVFAQLDEACLFPRSTDAMLVAKLHTLHAKKNPHYSRPARRRAGTCFVVHHSAASVTYDADGFIAKNKDRLSAGVQALLTASSLPVVVQATQAASSPGPPSQGTKSSPAAASAAHSLVGASAFLGSRFKEDVGRLLALLRSTRPHFIRCLKPNLHKRAAYAQPAVVHHQLAYLGVLDSIRIRHSGFSFRTPYAEFYARYILIAGGHSGGMLPYPAPPDADLRALCQQLLTSVVASQPLMADVDLAHEARFGLTRVFLRKTAAQGLEALREVVLQDMDRKAVQVQSAFRGHQARRALGDMWEGFLRLQAAYRAKLYRQQWLLRMEALRAIQRTVRAWLVQRHFERFKVATWRVQRWWRHIWRRARWLHMRRSLRVTHALARG